MVVWLRGPAHWLAVAAVAGVALGGCAIVEERTYRSHGSIKDDHAGEPRPAPKRVLVSRPVREPASSPRHESAKLRDEPKAPPQAAPERAPPPPPPSVPPPPVIAAPTPVVPPPASEPKPSGNAVVEMPSLPVAPLPAPLPVPPPPPVAPAPTEKLEGAPEKAPDSRSETGRQGLTTGSLPDPDPRAMARHAFDEGQKLFADGKVMEARRRFVSVLGAMPAEATLALARSFDNFYIARLRTSDGAPDPLRALQLYGRAAERGAKEARADLERIQDAILSKPKTAPVADEQAVPPSKGALPEPAKPKE